jgi:hypothetical protein
MLGIPNHLKSYNDTELLTKLPSNYLNAPLTRASNATRRTNLKKGFSEWGKTWIRRIVNPKLFFEEMEGLVGKEELTSREDDIKNLQAYNPFKNSESSINIRNSYINEKGVDYFEYNVENLFIDYIEKHIQSEEFAKLLTRAKGIELDLIMRGEVEADEKNIEQTLSVIDKYLSINVFNKSIMSDDAKAIESFLAPLRKAVSNLYVAGNIAGGIRDTFNGFLENITNAVIKY